MHHLADVTTESTLNRGFVTQTFPIGKCDGPRWGLPQHSVYNTFSIGYDCVLQCAMFEILVHHGIQFK